MIPEKECSLCPLCEQRTNIVLPDGDLLSPVALVGEAPGANEDIEGKPFVGKSGKILEDAMFEAGFCRRDVIITNTVKCRPPSNRNPTTQEMDACRPFLLSELENRRLIVGLGKSAVKSLTGYDGNMSVIANVLSTISINDKEIDFLPTYHPASTIYNKEARKKLIEAMEIVAEYI